MRDMLVVALWALRKYLGENKVMPFRPDLDKLKLDKIKDKLGLSCAKLSSSWAS